MDPDLGETHLVRSIFTFLWPEKSILRKSTPRALLKGPLRPFTGPFLKGEDFARPLRPRAVGGPEAGGGEGESPCGAS